MVLAWIGYASAAASIKMSGDVHPEADLCKVSICSAEGLKFFLLIPRFPACMHACMHATTHALDVNYIP
jgi:hypothetical protein